MNCTRNYSFRYSQNPTIKVMNSNSEMILVTCFLWVSVTPATLKKIRDCSQSNNHMGKYLLINTLTLFRGIVSSKASQKRWRVENTITAFSVFRWWTVDERFYTVRKVVDFRRTQQGPWTFVTNQNKNQDSCSLGSNFGKIFIIHSLLFLSCYKVHLEPWNLS